MGSSDLGKENSKFLNQNLKHQIFDHDYAKPWFDKNSITLDFNQQSYISFDESGINAVFDSSNSSQQDTCDKTWNHDSNHALENITSSAVELSTTNATDSNYLLPIKEHPRSGRRGRGPGFGKKQTEDSTIDQTLHPLVINNSRVLRRTRNSVLPKDSHEPEKAVPEPKRKRRTSKSLPRSLQEKAQSSANGEIKSRRSDPEVVVYHDVRRMTRSLMKSSQPKPLEEEVPEHIGKLVWGYCTGWWPAIIIDAEHVGAQVTEDKIWVFWLGEGLISQLNEKTKIEPFYNNLEDRLFTYLDTKQDVTRSRLKASVVTLKLISIKLNIELKKPYLAWAKDNLITKNLLNDFRFYPFPRKIKRRLDELRVQNIRNAEKDERHLKNGSRSSNSSDEEFPVNISKNQRRTSPNDGKQKSTESLQTSIDSCILPLVDQKPGVIVWGKISGHPWWPAMIMHHHDCGTKEPSFGCQWILWYGDYQLSQVHYQSIMKFEEGIIKMSDQINQCRRETYTTGVLNACKDYCSRRGLATEDWTIDDVSEWISTLNDSSKSETTLKLNNDAIPESTYSQHMTDKLNEIKRNQNVASERENKIKNSDIVKAISERSLDILRVLCIICLETCSDESEDHPFFECIICKECAEDYKSKVFAYGDDAKCFYCTLCAESGTIVVCDSYDCPRVYCTACLKHLLSPGSYEDILIKDPWYCFLCNDVAKVLEKPSIRIRENWKSTLVKLFHTDEETSWNDVCDHNGSKKKLRVLSLFDGIATGFLVLDKLGIQVEKYYASEIDENAIFVGAVHFGNRIHRLGDVRDITEDTIKNISPIDLLIGGSPCNDLSLANPNRLGLHDPNGTGVLFFEYCRIKKLVNEANEGRHVFWLFENVASMPSKYRLEINRHLGCQPHLIDSSDHSPQHRPRLFWSNIPISNNYPPPDPSQDLQSVLIPNCNRHALVKKIQTVTTKVNSLKQGKTLLRPVLMNGESDSLWITELEMIFGFPRHYTDVKNLSATNRQKLIGQAWSVQTITAILRPLYYLFQSVDKDTAA